MEPTIEKLTKTLCAYFFAFLVVQHEAAVVVERRSWVCRVYRRPPGHHTVSYSEYYIPCKNGRQKP